MREMNMCSFQHPIFLISQLHERENVSIISSVKCMRPICIMKGVENNKQLIN